MLYPLLVPTAQLLIPCCATCQANRNQQQYYTAPIDEVLKNLYPKLGITITSGVCV
jgi:hypothetical protein